MNLTGLLGLLGNNFIRPRSQKIEITLAVLKLSWYCDCHCFYQKLRKVRSFLICCFSLWTIFYLKFVNFSMKRNQPYRNVSWNGWLHAVEPCWLRANCCFFSFWLNSVNWWEEKNKLKDVLMRSIGEKKVTYVEASETSYDWADRGVWLQSNFSAFEIRKLDVVKHLQHSNSVLRKLQ